MFTVGTPVLVDRVCKARSDERANNVEIMNKMREWVHTKRGMLSSYESALDVK